MDKMINEAGQEKYVIKVNGQIVSIPFPSAQLAEAAIANLAEAHQAIAEVVPVTADGREVLLG